MSTGLSSLFCFEAASKSVHGVEIRSRIIHFKKLRKSRIPDAKCFKHIRSALIGMKIYYVSDLLDHCSSSIVSTIVRDWPPCINPYITSKQLNEKATNWNRLIELRKSCPLKYVLRIQFLKTACT